MQNTDDNTTQSGIDKSNYEASKNNKKTFLYLSIVILGILVAILLVVVLSRDSHYEQGNMYLREKRYAEALSEYQKVEASDKDFRMAQSKINYINGYQAYSMNLYPAAELYLSKVASDDEYYHDSQMMLDKIRLVTQNNKLDTVISRKDTVIVRQETTTKEGGNNTGTNKPAVSDAEFNKRFYTKLNGIIGSFESQYQSAAVAQVTSKRDYLAKMESIRRDLINSVNDAKEKDGDLTQLRNDINTWVDKRIAYINKLIAENSVSTTNTSRSLQEEGDKLYFRVTTQRNKVKGRY
jgi:hypothetical protein